MLPDRPCYQLYRLSAQARPTNGGWRAEIYFSVLCQLLFCCLLYKNHFDMLTNACSKRDLEWWDDTVQVPSKLNLDDVLFLISCNSSISLAVIAIYNSDVWYRDTASLRPYIGARMFKWYQMTMRSHLTGMRGADWINIHYEPCGFGSLSTSLVCGVLYVNLTFSCTSLRFRKCPIISLWVYVFVRISDMGSVFGLGCLHTYGMALSYIWNRWKPVCAIVRRRTDIGL